MVIIVQCDLGYIWLWIKVFLVVTSLCFQNGVKNMLQIIQTLKNCRKKLMNLWNNLTKSKRRYWAHLNTVHLVASCFVIYSVKHLCLNMSMQEKEEAKRLQSEPDDEGWITIGKGGRKPGASKVDAAELLEKKKKKQKVWMEGMVDLCSR